VRYYPVVDGYFELRGGVDNPGKISRCLHLAYNRALARLLMLLLLLLMMMMRRSM
jgi:hypothetical protein